MNAPYLKQLAFPVQGGKGPECNGMLLMDYFAAHAPQEIPHWFQHPASFEIPDPLSREAALEMQPGYADLPGASMQAIEHYMNDKFARPSDELCLIAEAAFAAISKRRREIEAAVNAIDAERYFAWRWHYALTMMRTRTNP